MMLIQRTNTIFYDDLKIRVYDGFLVFFFDVLNLM